LTTDAAGKVSYTLTDAAATATTTSDTVTFTSAANSSATKGSTVTYVTTVPVIATLTGYFDWQKTALHGRHQSQLQPS